MAEGIWAEKPEPVWVPRGYSSMSQIKEDDVQMIILDDLDAFHEKIKGKITQLNECLGEYESHRWCGHCIADAKCAQITMHVNELKEKAENWDRRIRLNLDSAVVALKKLEAIKTWLTKAKAQGYISISQGEKLDDILEVEAECQTE